MTIQRCCTIFLVLLLATGVAACASANPKEAARAEAAPPVTETPGEPVVASGTLEGMDDLATPFPAPVVAVPAVPQPTYPRSTGVTTDPGTRYLSTGVTGGLTVEIRPSPPPGS